MVRRRGKGIGAPLKRREATTRRRNEVGMRRTTRKKKAGKRYDFGTYLECIFMWALYCCHYFFFPTCHPKSAVKVGRKRDVAKREGHPIKDTATNGGRTTKGRKKGKRERKRKKFMMILITNGLVCKSFGLNWNFFYSFPPLPHIIQL